MGEEIRKENVPQLQPQNQFPGDAIKRSVQEQPVVSLFPGTGGGVFTWNLASAADSFSPWGRDVIRRDKELRDFWPSETYLAGAVANVAFRNTTLDWEIKHESKRIIQAVTEMLRSAIAGDSFGWVPFIEKFSQDLYTQDNGAFIEIIRDPSSIAGSRFVDERAPVIGIAHLDSNQCIRTGRADFPVVYIDDKGKRHKLAWYEVIPFADFPSAIERMHGVGYCSVSRALRMAQTMRSIMVFKDEKVSGRHFKQINFVSGISRQDIADEMTRGQENANNAGQVRFIMPAILASLDPEKPVSVATIDLASLPDGFDIDVDMKWYISGLALAFGVDYQEFAPLPGGAIGSSAQSMILHRKGTGKNPAVFMRTLSEAFSNYGVLPRNTEMRFTDRDEQEELERQEVRTGAMEEAAIAVNGKVLSPEAAAKMLVRRGILTEEDIADIPPEFWKMAMENNTTGQPVGNRGGNTIREDAGRQKTGKPNQTSGDRLRKALGLK